MNAFSIVLKLVSRWNKDEGVMSPFGFSIAFLLYIFKTSNSLCCRCERCDFKSLDSYKLRKYVVLSSQSIELSIGVIGPLLS